MNNEYARNGVGKYGVGKCDKIIAVIIVVLLFFVCFMAHFGTEKEPPHEVVREVEVK